jgi:predicted transglutaminase-like cysteine proteinase
MQIGADAPPGFLSFCIRFPDQCTQTRNTKAALTLDTSTWLLLNAVNISVNKSLWPTTDLAHYGRTEYWTIPVDGYGDCEDYALTKRRDLLRAGLASSVLRLAVVDSTKTGRHAVLAVSTEKGDFVLDNLTDEILPWNATGYAWIEAQSQTNPMRWDALRSAAYRGQATAAQPTENKTGNHVSVP